MRLKIKEFSLIILVLGMVCSCNSLKNQSHAEMLTRGLADTVGFAHLDWQMDAVMDRIRGLNQEDLVRTQQPAGTVWRTAICPHDDYTRRYLDI
jgi:hypothetical protein